MPPEAINLTLRRAVSLLWTVALPVVLGILFALSIVGFVSRDNKERNAELTPPPRVKANAVSNFKDAFATNVTVIGGLLAALLCAAGSSSTLLPGIETSRFALLNALWVALAALAPVFIAFGSEAIDMQVNNVLTPVMQTGWSWMRVGMGITLVAVAAELTTVGVLVSVSATSSGFDLGADVALVALAVVIAVYTVLTTRTLIKTQTADSGPEDAAPDAARNRARALRSSVDRGGRADPDRLSPIQSPARGHLEGENGRPSARLPTHASHDPTAIVA